MLMGSTGSRKKHNDIHAKESEWRVDRSTIEFRLEMIRSFPLSAEIKKNDDARTEVNRVVRDVSERYQTQAAVHVLCRNFDSHTYELECDRAPCTLILR